MKRLKLASILLSASCLTGILMASIVTGNEAPKSVRTAAAPLENPRAIPSKRPVRLAQRPVVRTQRRDAPDGIDQMITAAISKAEKIHAPIRKNVPRPQKAVGRVTKSITVRSGDTLYAIARRTGINLHKLAAINTLEPPFVIRPGQILSTRVE